MAQYISITGSAFGNGHDSSTTYSVTLPTGASGSVSLFGGGAVNAITQAELTAGVQLTIDDNTITSIGVLVNSGFACAGLTESGSWLLATATPTPLPATATPTPLPATATPEPATATPEPSTPTPTPDVATATPEPATATPLPATATPEPATATPEPATATPEPATATPEPATATPEPATATPIPYNYYTVRGCPGSFYENQDLRIRTTSTLTANGNPSTDSVIYHNGSSFYGYATIDESTWLVDADLPSITYSGAIDVGCPSSATATPTPEPATPTPTPTPLTAYTVFYDANSELTACAGTPADTIYSNCNPVNQGGSCTLYTDAGGTTPVAGGYYYDGLSGNYFYTEGSNGIVQEVGSCPVPSATPTPAPSICNSTSDVIRSLVDAESTCSGTGNIVYHNGPTGLSDASIIYVDSECSTVQSNTVWFNDQGTYYQWNGSTLTNISAPDCP